jgi:hypothetical protein
MNFTSHDKREKKGSCLTDRSFPAGSRTRLRKQNQGLIGETAKWEFEALQTARGNRFRICLPQTHFTAVLRDGGIKAEMTVHLYCNG